MIAIAILMLLCLPTLKAFSLSKIRDFRAPSIFLIKPSTKRLPKLFCSTCLPSSSEKDVDKMNNHLTDINLTEEEDELFTTLRAVVTEESLGTTVRVAGGWVRDKLLGVSGKEDIDIALDNMAGNDFAIALNKWHTGKGMKTFKIGVIQSNPEKSKHLETATVQLGKFSVDFVNLRTETYAENSRIPVMSFGTPEEDAMRRDLTINSLFYNIHSKEVEDYSRRGVQDLKAGIISTPLPALITLQDDPLRLLRAVRFACRFGFDITPELLSASADPSVRVALGTKVSRERVLQEVEQMLRIKSSDRAICLLHYIQLIPLILPVPPLSDLCLASFVDSSASNSNSNISGSKDIPESDTGDRKKKKKNNNDIEITQVLTPEECSFIARSVKDFHPYGCSAALIHLLLQNACTKSAEGGGHSTECLTSLSNTIANKTPFLFHFCNNLIESQSEETGKILRFAALTSLGYQLSPRNVKKKKFNNPLTENILLIDLKMRCKDVESAIVIQAAALVFSELIQAVVTYNRSGRPVTSTPTDTLSTGPAHGMLSRLQLGLAVRKAGALYPQAIQLAISHLILEILALESNNSSSSSSSSSSMKTDESTNDVMGNIQTAETPSVFYDIFDALVGACGVPKMADAITNYKQHTHVHSEALSHPLVDEISPRLISKLTSNDVTEVLIACNDVLEALTVLDLTESYKITPLLSGDLMKQVLKNIPKGTMFGEAMQCQVLWMLRNPNGTVEDFTSHIKKTFPAWV